MFTDNGKNIYVQFSSMQICVHPWRKEGTVGCYTWDKVTDGYEELSRELVAGKYPWKF